MLFHDDKPYLKLLKHVDMHLPIDWFFWLAETLGLYQPVEAFHWDWSFFARFHAVALGTLIYIGMGYILEFLLPLSGNPYQSRDADTAKADGKKTSAG